EFYAALLCPTVTIRHAFDRARHAVKSSANPKIASQYTLFHLLPEDGDHDVPVWATFSPNGSAPPTTDAAVRYYPPSMLTSDVEPKRGNQGYSFDRNLRPLAVRCIPAEAADSDDDDGGEASPKQPQFQPTERPSVPLGSSNLGIAGSPLESAAPVEDFLGRDIDIVRLCSILHTPRNRRVVAVTGPVGSGKRTLVTQTAMYYSLPGGRFFSGGACVVLLPRLWLMGPPPSRVSKSNRGATTSPKLYVQGDGVGGENDSLTAPEVAERFIRVVMKEIRTTVRLLKEWYPPQTRSTMPEDYEDEEELYDEEVAPTSHGGPLAGRRSPVGRGASSLAQPERAASSVNRSISSAHYAEKESIEELEMELFGATSSGMAAGGGLGTRGYKVFLAEQFADASALEQFLKGYNVLFVSWGSCRLCYRFDVPPIPVNRLLKELRENGTQLQDWGTGRLVRVVHVVRCMISDADEKEQEEQDTDGEHKKA
ncbi:hypothetical protein FOZ63_033954, partial [Perkinsus olseni]